MSGISIHLSIKIRILSLKSISFAMSNASCAWILLLSLFKDFFAKTLTDVRFDMVGKVYTTQKLPCHPLKGLPIIVTTLFGIVMLVRDLHAPKPQFPIVVTLFGIFMLVRESHRPKAPLPIVVTLFGIFMFTRNSQPPKASSPIVVTLFGIFMLMRDLQ